MNQTESALSKMFCENTGVALCDSGGSPKYDENGKYIGSTSGYGRNFEANSGRDFHSEPSSSLRFHTWRDKEENLLLDITVIHNTFHFLNEVLEYDNFMNAELSTFAEANPDDSWYEIRENFPDWYAEVYGVEIGGIYGEGNKVTVNTYNHENCLDQTLLYTYFTIKRANDCHVTEGDEYVVLQVHGGCDVRGGYTRPKVFKVVEETGIFEDNRAGILCSGTDHHPTALTIKEKQAAQCNLPGIYVPEIEFDEWHEHRWFNDGGSSFDSDDHNYCEDLEDYKVKLLSEEDNEWEYGKLCVTEDGDGYCPVCGAKLVACRR